MSYSDSNDNGTIEANSEIIQEKNYYPFGLLQKGYNDVINGTAHNYGFGGKEEQDELGLGWMDVTARNYDPALGRWMNLDPLAEKMRRHSPYNFGFNNPIYFQDYDGMMPTGPGNPIKKLIKAGIKRIGRSGKQRKLRSLLRDRNTSRADKGWIKSELNQIKNGKRKTIRNPPGKDLAHERGREAAKGYDYSHTNLQGRDLHKLQHKYDLNGTKNKERPIKELLAVAVVTEPAESTESANPSAESEEVPEFVKGLASFNAGLSDSIENAGTNVFGDNEFGQFLNDLNPVNLGLSDLFKFMDESFNGSTTTEDNSSNTNCTEDSGCD